MKSKNLYVGVVPLSSPHEPAPNPKADGWGVTHKQGKHAKAEITKIER